MNTFLFTVYPYICLAVFLVGSLLRFDRDAYTWKSDSTQLLRKGQLRWGSNLFHAGVLFLLFGHTVGLLTPHALYEHFIGAGTKQLFAVVSGGTAGLLCFIGLTILLHRRLTDARVRAASRRSDLFIAVLLWVQLLLGLATLPYSLKHSDGSAMLVLSDWAQRIVTLRPDASALAGVDLVFRLHLVLGMTLFLVFPFTRLVHVWSGLASVAYVFRPYQIVRSRRLNVPAAQRVAPLPVSAPAQPVAHPLPQSQPREA
jgi:nitrate reductase gamma subunit